MEATRKERITSIDLLRGTVIILMALDHVRMYLGEGGFYANPTDLTTTTPLLFFTRWITHFCAPVFIFLAGTSAFLNRSRMQNTRQLSRYLLNRGLWLVFVELVIVGFGLTFDITLSFHFLQVIWALGVCMMVLSALVYLPMPAIFAIGAVLVAGHNLLDPIQMEGTSLPALIWYILHQEELVVFRPDLIVYFHYPLIPLVGLMALGYVFGALYSSVFEADKRRQWLLWAGMAAILAFLILRGFNLYGEPNPWSQQPTPVYTLLSFLNTTKYPMSLQFILMTMVPALIFLALTERIKNRVTAVILAFGTVSLFFYIAHIYLIHYLALWALEFSGRSWIEYIMTAEAYLSESLLDFGFPLSVVYLVWILVMLVMYPLSLWYRAFKKGHPEVRLLKYI